MLLQGWDVGEENLGLQKYMVSQKNALNLFEGMLRVKALHCV